MLPKCPMLSMAASRVGPPTVDKAEKWGKNDAIWDQISRSIIASPPYYYWPLPQLYSPPLPLYSLSTISLNLLSLLDPLANMHTFPHITQEDILPNILSSCITPPPAYRYQNSTAGHQGRRLLTERGYPSSCSWMPWCRVLFPEKELSRPILCWRLHLHPWPCISESPSCLWPRFQLTHTPDFDRVGRGGMVERMKFRCAWHSMHYVLGLSCIFTAIRTLSPFCRFTVLLMDCFRVCVFMTAVQAVRPDERPSGPRA